MNVHPGGPESRNKLIACAHDFFGDIPVAVYSGYYLAHGLQRAKIAWPEQQEYVCCESASEEPGAQKKDIANRRGTSSLEEDGDGGTKSSFLCVLEKPRKMSVKLLED